MSVVDAVSGPADTIGRGLMELAALAAAYAMVDAFGSELGWVEIWRALGFGTFALLYLLVALRPRRSAGVWEIVFLNKAALAVAAMMLAQLPEAAMAGPFDAGLAVATLVAYGLTQGWRSWRA